MRSPLGQPVLALTAVQNLNSFLFFSLASSSRCEAMPDAANTLQTVRFASGV
jgi:hypothetical protein